MRHFWPGWETFWDALATRHFYRLCLAWAAAVVLTFAVFGDLGLDFHPRPGVGFRAVRLVLLTLVFYSLLAIAARAACLHFRLRRWCLDLAAQQAALRRLPACYDLACGLLVKNMARALRGAPGLALLGAWALFWTGLYLHHWALTLLVELP